VLARALALCLLTLCLIPTCLLAPPAAAHPLLPADRDAAAGRRRRLATALGDGYALLFAQPFTDVLQPRQEGNFLYVTGVREPGGLILLAGAKTTGFRQVPETKNGEGAGTPERARLYLPEMGARGRQFMALDFAPDAATAKKLGLATHALPRRHRPFAVVLAKLLPQGATLRIPRYRGGDDAFVRERKRKLVTDFGRARPDVKIEDLDALTTPMRAVKDATELAHLRRAIAITVDAFHAAVPVIRAGRSEADIEAAMMSVVRESGARAGFPFVVGSGRDAARPHYFWNNKTLPANSLVVVDAGAAVQRYSADITRTFPTSATFSERQRFVYAAVLEAQQAAIDQVRPGATLADVHKAAKRVLQKYKLAQFFIHGTSHHVGLDVHDPTARGALRAGMTITVEPGVYILAEKFGVRIEDIVLVTQDGHEVLTAALPKRPDAIEALLAPK